MFFWKKKPPTGLHHTEVTIGDFHFRLQLGPGWGGRWWGGVWWPMCGQSTKLLTMMVLHMDNTRCMCIAYPCNDNLRLECFIKAGL